MPRIRKRKVVPKPTPFNRAVSRAYVDDAITRAERHVETKSWADADETTIIGLYAWLHEKVYGVSAIPELRKDWRIARVAVKKLIREEFDSLDAVVDFVRWTWKRERDREKWRRENNREGGRITWRTQFSYRNFLVEYRVHLNRRSGLE